MSYLRKFDSRKKSPGKDWYDVENLPVKKMTASYSQILKALEETADVHIVFQDEEKALIVALIDNFEASLAIGNYNWCISSVYYGGATPGDNFWEWYVGYGSAKKDRRQYFIWNLKHPLRDFQLVGCTTEESISEFYCAYNLPNQAFDMEDYIEEVDGLTREMFFNNDSLRTNPSNV